MNFSLAVERVAASLGAILLSTGVWAATPAYELHVDGLACPFCAYGIEKKLGALEGVQNVETHIKDGAVIVTMKEGATLDEASAKKAVKEAGFSLRKLEQAPSILKGAPAEISK